LDLLERDGERAVLAAAIEESSASGRVALVVGEAGIGKTALVADACRGTDGVLWGACDPLITPRPLGPLRDVARQIGGGLQDALEEGSREAVLAATLAELANGAVLVVEDLHWADDATLDLVALLGRRLARERGCVILTCRGEARLEVRRVLGTLPREAVRRVEPPALSADAVAALARRAGRDPADLHAVSGGNPFFVTEALAAPEGGGVPASIRDAVSLRVALIGAAARAVVELAAVVPGPAELWLLRETVSAPAAAIDECIGAGLLRLSGESLAFRHDLARRAIADELSPLRRRELDLLVLAALEAAGDADPARLAHHARQAGDPDAIRRFAPPAARAASAAGGHRQALEHWEAALAVAGDDPEALEGVSVEAYLCGRPERALDARRALLRLHEARGEKRAAGDDLRWLSRILWWSGRGMEAAAVGDMAIAALEAFPDSRELAMALSGRSQLAMLAWEREQAIELGTRAIALARRIDDQETVTHALTNVGTALLGGPDHEQGAGLLEEAFTLAREIGSDDHAVRALINLGVGTLAKTRIDNGALERALAFARERELLGYQQYALGVRANLRLLRGEWDAAEADARSSLELGEQPGVSLCPALTALGRLQARRGDPEASATLDDAWQRAVASQELQRLAPAAAARAEHAWLEGDQAGTAAAARATYQLAVDRDEPWARGELAFWLWRAGEPVSAHPDDPAPYAAALAGDWGAAAEGFAELGFPYDWADMLSEADDEEARLEALATLDRLGAVRSASHLRRRLRADGVRRIPRGPRPASRAGLAGLTPRETEVLGLIVQGATNADIARSLVISQKTVDHHVSAVLAKLGVTSRREAAAAAERLATG
jgi:DNA-binding CsgD family transcriptional regulator/tetratricopeptide (TPR) repeat protein